MYNIHIYKLVKSHNYLCDFLIVKNKIPLMTILSAKFYNIYVPSTKCCNHCSK